jgi:trimeric autotransporter adhesin
MIKLNTLLVFLFMLLTTGAFAQVEQVTENQAGISKRLQFEIDITKDPQLGYVPKSRLIEASQTRKSKVAERNVAGRAPLFTWVERGPDTDVVGASNGNTRPGNGKTAGRVRAMWEDLGDPTGKTVWTGGIAGGLWKTTDITANPAGWTSINDFYENLAVASICQDPTDFNIMYFGTGEKAINADAVRGAGLWRSTDHGVTWSIMPGTANFWNVSKVICDAEGNLYVGCNAISNTSGLQRYTKATNTWTNITPTGLDPRVPDLELSSTGRLHIVCGYYNSSAATSGYRYTDNPATVTASTWTAAAVPFSTAQYNVALASNGNTLYALPSTSAFQVTTIYKSTNGGANWAATGTTPTFTSGQAWYCMAVAVDPNNANNVIVGSLDCFKTTNGGTSWTKISAWVGTTGQYVHADQQIITWNKSNRVLFGCDGGVHYSADGGTTITDRNVGLRIKQFYAVAVHPTLPNYFLAGAQDNGVHQLNNAGMGGSVEVTGGDGAYVHIDQDQPQFQWGSYVYNQYRRSTNGGSTWTSINYSSTAGRFINPTDYDDAGNIMYCSGNANAFVRWSNPQSGSTFASVTMSGLANGKVSAVKVSPYTSNTVFFAGGGSGVAPSIIKATNANATPVFTSLIKTGMTTTSANIACIELGTDEQNILAIYSNYGINNVWVTNNGGTTWTAIDGNLPDMPVRWAMFYPGDNSKVILATETGIWQTELVNGAATTWDPESTFPNVRTDMLQYRASDGLLTAATHGRGIFTSTFAPAPTCAVVTGLTATAITNNDATLQWASATEAVSYDVDYKLNSTTTWTNAATATTSLSASVTGLSEGSLYDYRVRANCAAATGTYTTAQFTTTAPATCNAPATLTATNTTSTGTSINWSATNGAASYDVEYKLSTDASWTIVATATTATTASISGLSASSVYDWRVKANCTAVGLTSAFAQAQFTTPAPPSCTAPGGLTATSVTESAATLSWSAVSGAANYAVEYKTTAASTWITAATATTATSVNLSGLSAAADYDWRVRANCTAVGLTSDFTQAQFTTAAAVTCPGISDVSTNGTLAGAATIALNTDVKGLINTGSDNDYYKFIITTGGTITVSLTTLPANYQLSLLNSAGTTLQTSANNNNANETISRSVTAGTYYARVYPRNNNSFNTSNCYNLNVQTGTATTQELPVVADASVKVRIYPNPVSDKLNVYVVGDNTQRMLTLFDLGGKVIYTQTLNDMFTTLGLQKLATGVYLIKITQPDGKVLYSEKFVKK